MYVCNETVQCSYSAVQCVYSAAVWVQWERGHIMRTWQFLFILKYFLLLYAHKRTLKYALQMSTTKMREREATLWEPGGNTGTGEYLQTWCNPSIVNKENCGINTCKYVQTRLICTTYAHTYLYEYSRCLVTDSFVPSVNLDVNLDQTHVWNWVVWGSEGWELRSHHFRPMVKKVEAISGHNRADAV